MKLYLTEILKEANAFGFGAPGMGGNSESTNMAQTAPGPTASTLMQPNQSAGGMMLPPTGLGMGIGTGTGMPGQPGGLQLGNPGFKSTI